MGDMVADSVPLTDWWEAIHESFIQLLKAELDNMRHTIDFLATTLGKLLETAIFGKLNENNPLGTQATYARTSEVKLYKIANYPNPSNILLENDVMVGIIDENNQLCLCVDTTNGIKLHGLTFNDQVGQWCYVLIFLGSLRFGT